VWLEDVITEATNSIFRLTLVVEIRKIIHHCNQHVLAISGLLRRVSFKKVVDVVTRIRRKTPTLPITQENPPIIHLSPQISISVRSEYTERPNSIEGRTSEDSEFSRRAIARQRFKGAVRSIIMMQQQQAGQNQTFLRPMMPPRTPSFDRNSTTGMSPTRFLSFGLNAIRGPRVPNLVPKLKSLEPVQDLSVHSALVRHLQFSPSGKYLATSRCVVATFLAGRSQAD